jgi:hypothetical protein
MEYFLKNVSYNKKQTLLGSFIKIVNYKEYDSLIYLCINPFIYPLQNGRHTAYKRTYSYTRHQLH